MRFDKIFFCTLQRIAVFGCAALLVAFTAGSAVAHHSYAAFDTAKTLAIHGTVKEFVWANPHSWLYLTVQRKDGTTQEWALEGASPNMMKRWGWKSADLNTGDKITVDANPSRDGRQVASINVIYLQSGKVLADPMGRPTTGEDIAMGVKGLPTKPQGTPLD